MRLFKPDCYAIITTDETRFDLSAISEKTDRRLDMSFNVFATSASDPNDGECTIYNLSETTRNRITEGSKVEVYAGYDGNYKLISMGDIEIVNSRKPGTDWATTIEWGDGSRAYIDVNFTRSYKEGVKVGDILDDLTSSLGLAVNSVSRTMPDVLNGGLSVNGKTKDILNKMTKDYGLEWSIQDEEVRVLKQGEPIDENAIVISQETGLLEFPQITEKGVNFICQLNPDLRPRKIVNIKSIGSTKVLGTDPLAKLQDKANGLQLIESVRFSGDNFGGAFQSKVRCNQYNA